MTRSATPRWACLLLVALLLPSVGVAEVRQKIPAEYSTVYEFLQFIKRPKEPKNGYEPSDAPRWDQPRLLAYLARDGVTFSDINEAKSDPDNPPAFTLSKKTIQRSLARRQGRAFRALAHLSHLYSLPYEQYSRLSFRGSDNGVVVNVASGYKLTFVAEEGVLRLKRVDYLTTEGC